MFAYSRIEDCIAVFGNDYEICDSLLEPIPTTGELETYKEFVESLKKKLVYLTFVAARDRSEIKF